MVSRPWATYQRRLRYPCRVCTRRNIPIRETPQGDLCFLCWYQLPQCPVCGGRLLGGSCDECATQSARDNLILSSSPSGGSDVFSEKRHTRTTRNIVRSVKRESHKKAAPKSS
jgi:hypothetical protein